MSEIDLSSLEEKVDYNSEMLVQVKDLLSSIDSKLSTTTDNISLPDLINNQYLLLNDPLKQDELAQKELEQKEYQDVIKNILIDLNHTSVSGNDINTNIQTDVKSMVGMNEQASTLGMANTELSGVMVCGIGIIIGVVLASIIGRWLKW